MVNVDNVFFSTVAPSLGIAIANFLFLAPARAVTLAVRTQNLGPINPLPYPLIMANCAGWIGYSYVTTDLYVYFSNALGLLLGFYYTFRVYPLASSKMRELMMWGAVFFAAVISGVGCIGTKAHLSHHALQFLWGYTSNVILVVFYGMPLSTMWKVIRSRDARSLDTLLAIMTVVNGTLWIFYGLMKRDGFIWIPNAVGALFGAIQLVLLALFHKRKGRDAGSCSARGSNVEVMNVETLMSKMGNVTADGIVPVV